MYANVRGIDSDDIGNIDFRNNGDENNIDNVNKNDITLRKMSLKVDSGCECVA